MARVFVSSTYRDLWRRRAWVIQVLRDAGHEVDPMENWTADSREPTDFSTRRIEGNVVILLVAFRSGHVPLNETLNIIQLEVERARAKGIDVLPFLLKEVHELDRDPGVRAWRQELTEHRGVGFFDREPDSVKVLEALSRWREQAGIGGRPIARSRGASE